MDLNILDSYPKREQKENIMKRRRGIELQKGRGSPIYMGELDDVARDLRSMMEWECVGSSCVRNWSGGPYPAVK